MQINTFDHFVQQEDTEMKKEDGRVRITRQMIRTALLNLLREKPLQHITVRELCEKASINRGTFYAHYDDIYDLMEQIEQSMFNEFKAILRPLLEDQDPYDLVETITRIFSYIRETPTCAWSPWARTATRSCSTGSSSWASRPA